MSLQPGNCSSEEQWPVHLPSCTMQEPEPLGPGWVTRQAVAGAGARLRRRPRIPGIGWLGLSTILGLHPTQEPGGGGGEDSIVALSCAQGGGGGLPLRCRHPILT